MIPNAVLIQQPAIDFSTFLSVTSQALGYSPSTNVDGSHRRLHDVEKFTSCLAAIKDEQAPVGLPPYLMAHVSFSLLVMADDDDMQDALEYCAGMPFVRADTLMRGVSVAVITGTLSQWRDAVISGCGHCSQPSVRILFNRILNLFESVNLNVWKDCDRKQTGDTFLLEDHRRNNHV